MVDLQAFTRWNSDVAKTVEAIGGGSFSISFSPPSLIRSPTSTHKFGYTIATFLPEFSITRSPIMP